MLFVTYRMLCMCKLFLDLSFKWVVIDKLSIFHAIYLQNCIFKKNIIRKRYRLTASILYIDFMIEATESTFINNLFQNISQEDHATTFEMYNQHIWEVFFTKLIITQNNKIQRASSKSTIPFAIWSNADIIKDTFY